MPVWTPLLSRKPKVIRESRTGWSKFRESRDAFKWSSRGSETAKRKEEHQNLCDACIFYGTLQAANPTTWDAPSERMQTAWLRMDPVSEGDWTVDNDWLLLAGTGIGLANYGLNVTPYSILFNLGERSLQNLKHFAAQSGIWPMAIPAVCSSWTSPDCGCGSATDAVCGDDGGGCRAVIWGELKG